jgi:hypothetical protein
MLESHTVQERNTSSMSLSTTSRTNREKSEADIWKERYYALKRWVEENNINREYEHPWWKTVNKPSQGHVRKDMDLL